MMITESCQRRFPRNSKRTIVVSATGQVGVRHSDRKLEALDLCDLPSTGSEEVSEQPLRNGK